MRLRGGTRVLPERCLRGQSRSRFFVQGEARPPTANLHHFAWYLRRDLSLSLKALHLILSRLKSASGFIFGYRPVDKRDLSLLGGSYESHI
jgi:hypothetical protein